MRNAKFESGNDLVLSVHSLGKMYHLYDRPQDRLKQAFLWGRKQLYREFWALRDVSFEVRRGEMLGIIGRNGSGKSTLLQIIAGVLRPTTGELEVHGRVAALLELGSGFNPEFTGRENVFLNGAILGVPREEVARRFEEIAAFADIGEFLEQPVKTYSSGMFLRLAFAVTTSLDPDVLLIDEALAVGDVFFRQKCYKRLETLRERGASIILVSHAMMDVEQFCGRAVLLHRGSPVFTGGASEAVKRYYLIEQEERLGSAAVQPTAEPAGRPISAAASVAASSDGFVWPPEAFLDISKASEVSNGWARCTGVALCNEHGEACGSFQQGETASFCYEFEVLQDIEVPIGGVVVHSDKGVIVHGKSTLEYGSDVPVWVARGTRLRFRQEIALEIGVGEYTFTVGLAAIPRQDFENRTLCSHEELQSRVVRLCHIPGAGHFAVGFRYGGRPIQLLHHGIANLPGHCRVLALATPNSDDPAAQQGTKEAVP
jgi:ABC-type polysaccharide/polyol phosphate transport system ATPase subunit